MNLRHATFAALAAAFAAAPAFAQVGTLPQITAAAEIQRRQELVTDPGRELRERLEQQEQAPALYEDEMSDVGRQFLVKVKPRVQWFEARADSQFYYTSNFTFSEPDTDPDPIDTSVLVSTAEFALSPAFDVGGARLNPRLGYRHQWYNYDVVENDLDPDGLGSGLNNFDFDIQTVFAELRCTLPGGDWYLYTGAEWSRYLSHEGPIDDYAEFYKEFLPYLGVQKSFPINDRNLFALQYEVNLHVTETTPTSALTTAEGIPLIAVDENGTEVSVEATTDPRPNAYINDRMDHTLTVSYLNMPCDILLLRPFYRLIYTDYLKGDWGDRNDTIHTFGLITSLQLAEWCQLRGFITYDVHSSDDEIIPDYQKWDAGTGVTLSVRF